MIEGMKVLLCLRLSMLAPSFSKKVGHDDDATSDKSRPAARPASPFSDSSHPSKDKR